MLSARHSTLQDVVARWLISLPGWTVVPEVSFAIYAERGVIDLLAWHAPTETLLVIEVKTEIVDLQDVLGVLDRKTRLASRFARERGWHLELWRRGCLSRRAPRIDGASRPMRHSYVRRCPPVGDRCDGGSWPPAAASRASRFCHIPTGVALSDSRSA